MTDGDGGRLSVSSFRDTILRTLLIMAVAVVFIRILELPNWMMVVAVAGGIVVIVHAYVMIRRINRERSDRDDGPPD